MSPNVGIGLSIVSSTDNSHLKKNTSVPAWCTSGKTQLPTAVIYSMQCRKCIELLLVNPQYMLPDNLLIKLMELMFVAVGSPEPGLWTTPLMSLSPDGYMRTRHTYHLRQQLGLPSQGLKHVYCQMLTYFWFKICLKSWWRYKCRNASTWSVKSASLVWQKYSFAAAVLATAVARPSGWFGCCQMLQ